MGLTKVAWHASIFYTIRLSSLLVYLVYSLTYLAIRYPDRFDWSKKRRGRQVAPKRTAFSTSGLSLRVCSPEDMFFGVLSIVFCFVLWKQPTIIPSRLVYFKSRQSQWESPTNQPTSLSLYLSRTWLKLWELAQHSLPRALLLTYYSKLKFWLICWKIGNQTGKICLKINEEVKILLYVFPKAQKNNFTLDTKNTFIFINPLDCFFHFHLYVLVLTMLIGLWSLF